MRRLYISLFLVVFALTIYGSGLNDSSEFTTKISARLKRTDNPSLWAVNATTPKIEILDFGDTGVVSDLPVKEAKLGKKKIVLRKKDVMKLAKDYDLTAVKKRKALMKKVKGLSRKLPFKKKSTVEEKLEIHPLIEIQGATGITNDRIGEIDYPSPIVSRIKKIGNKFSIRRRTSVKAEQRADVSSGEIEGYSTELPDSKEAIVEETTIFPEVNIDSTTLPGDVLDLSTETSEISDELLLKPPSEHAPVTWDADAQSSSKTKEPVEVAMSVTKRPLLSRVKNLGKKLPLRRKAQLQSKMSVADLDAEEKGVEENRILRLNVWWVRNFVVTDDSKPTAYYDEETIAVIGFDGTINATACRLLEPVLKEEKEKALNDLSAAGVNLKPVDLDTMMDLIAGCKTEGVADDKWNAWTLLNGIAPGTKWCGRGDIAKSYEELGPEADIDRCCRAHDHCPIKIKPFKRKYGLTNLSLYTKSHCDCDDEFEMCLRATKNPLADILANFYFNVLKIQCVEESKSPSENCLSRNDCDTPRRGKMHFRDPRKFVKKVPA